MTQILDGFNTAKQRRLDIKNEVEKYTHRKPGLTVVIVGEDPASQTEAS